MRCWFLVLLVGCSAPPPPPAAPPPTPEPTASATPTPQGLTADELLAMDEEAGYTAATGVLENIEESVAPPVVATETIATTARQAPKAPRRARGTPRRAPTPKATPRPYRFRGWEEGVEGFEEIAEEHDQGQKTVIVYFHTDWCGWCRRLENDYFDNPRFSRWLDRVPRVHINPEDSEGDREIARMFKVTGYPTFTVMPGGNSWYSRLHPFGRGGEHQTVDDFLADVKAAAAKK